MQIISATKEIRLSILSQTSRYSGSEFVFFLFFVAEGRSLLSVKSPRLASVKKIAYKGNSNILTSNRYVVNNRKGEHLDSQHNKWSKATRSIVSAASPLGGLVPRVSRFVFLDGDQVSAAPSTFFAFVRPFAGVSAHVNFKMAVFAKCLLTDFAYKRFFPAMSAHVSTEFRLFAKCLLTRLAFKGLAASVDQFVSTEVP